MSLSTIQRFSQVEFSLGELTGALGDSITVLPLVVAIGALSDLSIGMMLLGFGIFQILWGLYYGAPVSVEPMKALAALVIAGGLSTQEFTLAGLVAGSVLLFLGRTHTLGRIQSYIGQPVVRGVQLGVALLLLETGIQLGVENLRLSLLAAVLVLLLIFGGSRQIAPLVVLGVGGLLAVLQVGAPSLAIPSPSTIHLSGDSVAIIPVIGATAGQLAMTVGNAAVATSLLISEYFEADVSPDQLASSMGVMNLLAVPFGMIPMCHGSGGVAGKYTFGARTAGSNVILGILYIGAALLATGIVMAFPLSILGVVLVLVALELGRTSLKTDHWGVTILIGVVSVLTNIGVGFASGLLVFLILDRWRSVSGGLVSWLSPS